MNTAVTPELIRELEPDLVISAVGGEPFIPPIEVLIDGNVIFAASMHKLGAVPGNKYGLLSAGDLWDVRRLSPLRRMERM